MDGGIEKRKEAIAILLKEITGKDIEITEKILNIYKDYTYEELTIPWITIMRNDKKSYGKISVKIGVKPERVRYILTREIKPKKK